MRRRLMSLFGCLVLAGAMSQAAMGPSAAEENPAKPSPAPAQQTPLERAQEPLIAIAEKIKNLASRQNLDRYTGVEVSPERNLVVVYWAGQVPQSVVAILDQARREGITTEVRPAKYSKAQLDHARHAVIRDPRSLAVGVSLVYPNRDGSGITVGVAGSLTQARGLDAVHNSAVPITLYSQPMMKPVLGRYNDTAPFWEARRIMSTVTAVAARGLACMTQTHSIPSCLRLPTVSALAPWEEGHGSWTPGTPADG